MLFYFSATGNTRHVARRIARDDEQVVPMEDALRTDTVHWSIEDGRLGILTPVYAWTLPSLVREFLERATFEIAPDARPYTFFIGTCGTTVGAAGTNANALMRRKGLPFDAQFDVYMPDTWTPMFDLSDTAKVAQRNEEADRRIAEVRDQLDSHATGKHMKLPAPGFTGLVGKQIYDRSMRLTDKFTVDDTCIGCGLCAKRCPVGAIEMHGKRPVWVQERCAMCLRCLHMCPKFAIQRGPHTRAHGQYKHA